MYLQTARHVGTVTDHQVGSRLHRGAGELCHVAAVLSPVVLRVKRDVQHVAGLAARVHGDNDHIVVGGQVMKPGKFELRGPLTMTDAVAIAGGFSTKAHTRQVMLFRRISNEMVETKQIDLKAVLHGKPEEDVALRPGDSIFVPSSKLGKVERFMEISNLGLYFPLPVSWR